MDASNITTAYLIGGKIYNRNEMGMVLWGAMANKAGFFSLKDLGNWNEAIHKYIEGNGDEYNEVKAWNTGFNVVRGWEVMQAIEFTRSYYNNSPGVDPTGDGLTYPYSETNKKDATQKSTV